MHILHILSLGTISPCPLIMDAADGVSITSFQARPESSIHLLLHLSISSLDGAQIPLTAVVPLDLRAKTCSHILGKTSTKLPVINCAVHTWTEEAAPPPTPIRYTGPPIFTTSIPDGEKRRRCESSIGTFKSSTELILLGLHAELKPHRDWPLLS